MRKSLKMLAKKLGLTKLFAHIKAFYNFGMNIVDTLADAFGISRYFARFLVSGAINTAFGYIIFSFFIFLGCGDFISPLISMIASIIFNFNTIGGMVFGDRSKKLFGRFCLVYMFLYCFEVSGLKLFAYFGVENRYISGFILLFPMAILSYLLNKNFVFRK